jgi:thiosulfate dehydrogenase [quinone] large subunit
LRAFLGFTFCFAGLQKLANPNFLNANSPSSIQAQLLASIRVSPLHSILGHLLRFAEPIGIVIALAELAVGIGLLLGLWTRIAACGGLILAFTLFLTVSFHSSPYYTGADIVFFFACIPLILAGSGGVFSVDGLISARAADEFETGPPTMVPVRFALVQQVCGHYKDDACAAKDGAPCDVRGCPFLAELDRPGGEQPLTAGGLVRNGPDAMDRRKVVIGGGAVAAAAVVGGLSAGAAASLGRAIGGAKAPSGPGTVALGGSRSGSTTTTTAARAGGTTTTTAGPSVKGTVLGSASQVPVGGAATFRDPASGDPGLVIQQTQGKFVAFDAVCPHAGCTVGWSSAAGLIVCPCHGSEFDPSSGAVISPPAPRGLTPIPIAVDSQGQLVVDG